MPRIDKSRGNADSGEALGESLDAIARALEQVHETQNPRSSIPQKRYYNSLGGAESQRFQFGPLFHPNHNVYAPYTDVYANGVNPYRVPPQEAVGARDQHEHRMQPHSLQQAANPASIQSQRRQDSEIDDYFARRQNAGHVVYSNGFGHLKEQWSGDQSNYPSGEPFIGERGSSRALRVLEDSVYAPAIVQDPGFTSPYSDASNGVTPSLQSLPHLSNNFPVHNNHEVSSMPRQAEFYNNGAAHAPQMPFWSNAAAPDDRPLFTSSSAILSKKHNQQSSTYNNGQVFKTTDRTDVNRSVSRQTNEVGTADRNNRDGVSGVLATDEADVPSSLAHIPTLAELERAAQDQREKDELRLRELESERLAKSTLVDDLLSGRAAARALGMNDNGIGSAIRPRNDKSLAQRRTALETVAKNSNHTSNLNKAKNDAASAGAKKSAARPALSAVRTFDDIAVEMAAPRVHPQMQKKVTPAVIGGRLGDGAVTCPDLAKVFTKRQREAEARDLQTRKKEKALRDMRNPLDAAVRRAGAKASAVAQVQSALRAISSDSSNSSKVVPVYAPINMAALKNEEMNRDREKDSDKAAASTKADEETAASSTNPHSGPSSSAKLDISKRSESEIRHPQRQKPDSLIAVPRKSLGAVSRQFVAAKSDIHAGRSKPAEAAKPAPTSASVIASAVAESASASARTSSASGKLEPFNAKVGMIAVDSVEEKLGKQANTSKKPSNLNGTRKRPISIDSKKSLLAKSVSAKIKNDEVIIIGSSESEAENEHEIEHNKKNGNDTDDSELTSSSDSDNSSTSSSGSDSSSSSESGSDDDSEVKTPKKSQDGVDDTSPGKASIESRRPIKHIHAVKQSADSDIAAPANSASTIVQGSADGAGTTPQNQSATLESAKTPGHASISNLQLVAAVGARESELRDADGLSAQSSNAGSANTNRSTVHPVVASSTSEESLTKSDSFSFSFPSPNLSGVAQQQPVASSLFTSTNVASTSGANPAADALAKPSPMIGGSGGPKLSASRPRPLEPHGWNPAAVPVKYIQRSLTLERMHSAAMEADPVNAFKIIELEFLICAKCQTYAGYRTMSENILNHLRCGNKIAELKIPLIKI